MSWPRWPGPEPVIGAQYPPAMQRLQFIPELTNYIFRVNKLLLVHTGIAQPLPATPAVIRRSWATGVPRQELLVSARAAAYDHNS
jgi:hypothetical protein